MCNAGAASASAALSDVKASAAVALRNGPEVGHIITESCMHQGDAQQCQVGWQSYQGEARLSSPCGSVNHQLRYSVMAT